MKKILPVFLLLLGFAAAAQPDSLAPYKRFPTVPAFRLLLTDSTTWFTKNDLPRKTATLVMVFSPDCDHCKHETEEIIKHMSEFKKIEIVMATMLSFEKMKEFYVHYNLQRFKNIRVGKDVNYMLPVFYNMRNMPFMAFYDKKGNLIDATGGSLPIEQVVKKFKN